MVNVLYQYYKFLLHFFNRIIVYNFIQIKWTKKIYVKRKSNLRQDHKLFHSFYIYFSWLFLKLTGFYLIHLINRFKKYN
jgi:hypothetical protein